jgi:hypothetical protein
MFTTPQEVKRITGYDVTNELIHIAQSVVESYVGRVEGQVTNGLDKQLLERATAYQSAYMVGDGAKVFEQVNVLQVQQFGLMQTMHDDGYSPYVAKMTAITCRNLSWKKSSQIRVEGMFDHAYQPYDFRRD